MLWPHGAFWDVRYFNRQADEMLSIADEPFSDESAAWLAAFTHWEELNNKKQFSYFQKDARYDEVLKRIPVIEN